MKKLFNSEDIMALVVLIVFFLVGMFCMPTLCGAQEYVREGNTLVAKTNARTKSEPKDTGFYWEEAGQKYKIYMGSTGSCFILKTSKKTGKEYRKYLGPKASKDVCQVLGVEYKGKDSKDSK